jgi:hypothetical protein
MSNLNFLSNKNGGFKRTYNLHKKFIYLYVITGYEKLIFIFYEKKKFTYVCSDAADFRRISSWRKVQ